MDHGNVAGSSASGSMETRKGGFTIMELIVVITIIGILAATVLVNMEPYPDKARVTRVRADFGAIRSAMSMFQIDQGRIPDSLDELSEPALITNSAQGDGGGPYLDFLPLDPWTGEPYHLEVTSDGRLLVISYGRDMQPGGVGVDADIRSDERR